MNDTHPAAQQPPSVDGCLFDLVDGEWTFIGYAGKARTEVANPTSLSDGHVSVDGALMRVEPSRAPG